MHAVVAAPVPVRVEMLRKGRTYELLITQHRPGKASDGKRPPLETKVLFRAINGRLELDDRWIEPTLVAADENERSKKVASVR